MPPSRTASGIKRVSCLIACLVFSISQLVFASVSVNDLHSKLNATDVREVLKPLSVEEVQAAVRRAKKEGIAVSISGGRHAMGGQQFGTDTLHLDMTGMKNVLSFDGEKGVLEAEAGIEWPDLIHYLQEAQKDRAKPWSIRQKQTGADRLTLGGALSANIHGRGLFLKPIIADVESFRLVNAEGDILTCSRSENAELFRAAIGGYGLFGVITSVKLKLVPRVKLLRSVVLVDAKDLISAFQKKIDEGYVFGDFQYTIDPDSHDFMLKGIFSCYKPVDEATPMPAKQKALSLEAWKHLAHLAHHDKRATFEMYAKHYLSTDGQVYWSDTHSLSVYDENYHKTAGPGEAESSEMITELYVPRGNLFAFLKDLRRDSRRHRVNVIYGTIRLIEEDDESFLRWAKHAYACVICNVHVEHTPEGRAKAARDFQRMIDRALAYGGSYYLTYHRWARPDQVEKAYPEFRAFLALKKKFDPAERFQSEWYRHYRKVFSEV